MANCFVLNDVLGLLILTFGIFLLRRPANQKNKGECIIYNWKEPKIFMNLKRLFKLEGGFQMMSQLAKDFQRLKLSIKLVNFRL